MHIAFLIVPSLTAILIKLLIFWLGRNSIKNISPWVCLFLIGLFGANFIELISFIFLNVAADWVVKFFLTAYYGFLVVCSVGFLAIACELTGKFNKRNSRLIAFLMLAGLLVLVVPGAGLNGFESIGYSFTRIPGDFYWVLQFVIPGGWLIGLTILFQHMKKGEDWYSKRRAYALLLATSPAGIGILFVAILMQLNYQINATLVISVTTNFFLAVLIYTEYEYRLFRFLSCVPATEENKIIKQAAKVLSCANNSKLAVVVSDFEKILIEDSLRKHGYNKMQTANFLGISKTTLNRKIMPS